ncbi:glycosyltransferase family 2 protein [Gramella sp. BOM4]|nr:glycosyltransferase family 2 protein [Christiangramia bathymodioli]
MESPHIPEIVKESLVSIIIPTYNRAYILGQSLDSVLAQHHRNWECIVIDDDSTDYTKELLEFYCTKDSRIKYFTRPNTRSKGANSCRNFGFEQSKGDYIQWFDSDDVMLENFLTTKVNEIRGLDLVVCSGFICNTRLEKQGALAISSDKPLFRGMVTWEQQIVTNSVLFNRNFLEGKKLFDPKISRGQEANLFSRLFYNLPESRYKIIDIPLFLYRQHETSKTAQNKSYRADFVISQVQNMLENYKRGKSSGNEKVIEHCYKYLLKFYFKARRNRDWKNSFRIWYKLLTTVRFKKFSVYLEIFVIGFIFNLVGVPSYRLEKRWKSFPC